MKEIQSELVKLKKGIEEAHSNVAKLEGREEELLNQLKKDFNLSSVKEAEKAVAKMKEQLATKETEIRTQFDKLKEEYDW